MKCPADDRLILHLDGAVDAAEARDLERHLLGCAPCADRLRALESLESLVARPEPLPEGLLARVLALPEGEAGRPRLTRRPTSVVITAIGATAIAATLLVALRIGAPPEAPPSSPTDVTRSVPTALEPREDLRPLVLLALTLPDAEAQARLEEAGDRVLPVLRSLARAPEASQARRAIHWLGRFPRRDSLPVLLEVAQREDRRSAAIEALGALGDERALATLAPFLGAEAVAEDALEAVLAIGGEAAARTLGRRLEVSEGRPERLKLVEALARTNSASATRRLVGLTVDEALAEAAWTCLRRHEGGILPHLLDLAVGRSEEDALRALAVLERLAPASSVPSLEPLLDDRRRRRPAAGVLARIDTPQAADALLACKAFSEVRDVFRLAGTGLERRLLERIVAASRHERVRLIDVLGLCGSAAAVPVLERLADDPALAPHTLTALGRMGGDASVEALERLSSLSRLRRDAIDALGFSGAPSAVPALVRIASAHRRVRSSVLRALSRLPHPQAVEAIVRLGADDPRQSSSVRTLRDMDREVVIPALVAMLGGEHGSEARRALRTVDPARASLRRSP